MPDVVNQNSRVKKGGTLVTETVITDTTTTIGEIGLTGGAAVDVVKTLDKGATDRTALALGTVQAINQEAGEGFSQLVGGANRLIQTTGEVGADFFARSAEASDNLLDATTAASREILVTTNQAAADQFNAARAARGSAERQLERVQLGGESPDDRNKTLMLLVGGVILAVVATGFFR